MQELADRYGLKLLEMAGFLDGINESLITPNPIETMEAEVENNPEALFLSREYAEILESKLQESLSDLESRVLYLHLRGTDYKIIARLLDKSPKTVDNAIQRIRSKAEKILEQEKSGFYEK